MKSADDFVREVEKAIENQKKISIDVWNGMNEASDVFIPTGVDQIPCDNVLIIYNKQMIWSVDLSNLTYDQEYDNWESEGLMLVFLR